MTRVVRALPALLFLAALVPPHPAHAAWTLLSNGTGQKAGYFQLSAADATHAMAVGTHDDGSGNQAGVVAITSDGQTWEQTKPSTSPIAFYTAVHMVSAQKAFVGMTGQVLVTTNGGASWTPYKEADWGPLKGPLITGIGFANQSVGYLCGSAGTIRKTTDGGTTWTAVTGPAGIDWAGLFVRDESHLWLWAGSSITDDQTGEVTGYENGTLAFSADGGATFTTVFQGEARAIAKVFMINSDEGYMTSNSMSGPKLEHTTDGGKTWTALTLPTGVGPHGATQAPDAVWDVFFFDLCEGFLIQENSENTQLMYTTDKGATWTQAPYDPFKLTIPLPIAVWARLIAMDFPSRTTGFAGGFYETIAGYAADGAGPNCGAGNPDGGNHSSDGGGGGDDGGGGGCGCRAAGTGGALACAALAIALCGGLCSRRWRRRG
jgi:photosystem II stability/assembly factor-like uncharacterized protein